MDWVGLFFNFSGVFAFLIGILTLIGFIIALKNIKKANYRAVIIIFMSVFIATFHFFITKPLFNKWMEPGHVFTEIWVGQILLIILGVATVVQILSKLSGFDKKIMYGIIFVLVFIPAIFVGYNNFNNDRWTQYGETMDPSTQMVYDVGDWLIKNTNNNELVLANDESAFMINAISGKRVVFSRRVHASYFEDVDQKYADGVVMLFGQNKSMTQELLKKYNVKYVYMDSMLVSSPIIVNLKYEQYMRENGINYTIQDVRWDPSTANAATFTSIVVSPNMNSSLFANDATDMTTVAKAFYVGKQVGAIIYQIKT